MVEELDWLCITLAVTGITVGISKLELLILDETLPGLEVFAGIGLSAQMVGMQTLVLRSSPVKMHPWLLREGLVANCKGEVVER